MRIAKGGVGDEEPLLGEGPLREFLRAQLIEQLARAGWGLARVMLGDRRRGDTVRPLLSRDFRISIDYDVPEISE